MSTAFPGYRTANPCGACGRRGKYYCRERLDGNGATCRRSDSHKVFGRGQRRVSKSDGQEYFSFRRKEAGPGPSFVPDDDADDGPHPDRSPLAAFMAKSLTDELAAELAASLRLPGWAVEAFRELNFGWHEDPDRRWVPVGWRFPERDADGRVIGFVNRTREGKKETDLGSKRGLHLPPGWKNLAIRAGFVLVVEGPTDTAAGYAAGLPVVGLPFLGGIKYLRKLFLGLPDPVKIVFVAERDEKPDGLWPGLRGTKRSAKQLAKWLGRPVGWALVPAATGRRSAPPVPVKDTRDWLAAAAGATGTRTTWRAAGDQFARSILADATFESPTDPRPPARLDPTRLPRCNNQRNVHLKGKPDTRVEGVHEFFQVRCKQWNCEHCRQINVNVHDRHFFDRLCEADAAGSRPPPRTPGNEPHPQTPVVAEYYRLGWADVPLRQWSALCRQLDGSCGKYVRIICSGLEERREAPYKEWLTGLPDVDQIEDGIGPVVRVLAAIPADQRFPKLLTPIGLTDAVAKLGDGLRRIRPDPDNPARHPVRASADWRPPEPGPGNYAVGTATGMNPSEIRLAGQAVGLSAGSTLQHEDVRGPVVRIVGEPILVSLFDALVAKRDDGPVQTVGEVVGAFRLWAPHLPAGTIPGPGVLDVIAGRLWQGPDAPTLVRLADAIAAAPELEQFFKDTEGIDLEAFGFPAKPGPRPGRARVGPKEVRFRCRQERARRARHDAERRAEQTRRTEAANRVLDTIRH